MNYCNVFKDSRFYKIGAVILLIGGMVGILYYEQYNIYAFVPGIAMILTFLSMVLI